MTDKDTPAPMNAPHVPGGWPAQPAQPWDVRPVAGTSVTTALPVDETRAEPSWALAANGTPPAPSAPVVPAQAPPPPPQPAAGAAGGPGGPSWFEADLGEQQHPAPAARKSPKLVAAAVVGAGALLLGGYAIGSSLGGSDTTQLASQQGPGGQLGGPPGMSGQQGQSQQGQSQQGQSQQGQSQQGQSQQGQSQQGQSGQLGGPPGAAQGGTSAGMVVGQVTAVSGSTLTLTTQSGTATVAVSSSTTVDGTAGGDLSALSTGSLVFVQGSQGSDGTWTATSVSTTPPGMSGQQGQQAPPGQGQAQSGTTNQGSTNQGTTDQGTTT